MSSLRNPETLLRAWRPDRPNEGLIEKAGRAMSEDPVLRRRVEEQSAFDVQLAGALHAIQPQAGMRERVTGQTGEAKRRPQFAWAAYLAAFCGIATVVVLLVLFALDHGSPFPGSETVSSIIASADGLNGRELEPVANKAGDLGDWFYVRGFEAYSLPKELVSAPAVGSRLFKLKGSPVAQVAVDWHHAIFYVFRADAFGVVLPPGEWRAVETDNWQAVVRKDGNNCTIVALHGHDPAEMTDLLHALQTP